MTPVSRRNNLLSRCCVINARDYALFRLIPHYNSRWSVVTIANASFSRFRLNLKTKCVVYFMRNLKRNAHATDTFSYSASNGSAWLDKNEFLESTWEFPFKFLWTSIVVVVVVLIAFVALLSPTVANSNGWSGKKIENNSTRASSTRAQFILPLFSIVHLYARALIISTDARWMHPRFFMKFNWHRCGCTNLANRVWMANRAYA